MATSSATAAAGGNMNDLKELIERDIEYSEQLQKRIDEVHKDIIDGKAPEDKIDLMESTHKEVTRDLVHQVDRIEDAGNLTATDREMLQALNARLVVLDKLAMRLAELRDVRMMHRGENPWDETIKGIEPMPGRSKHIMRGNSTTSREPETELEGPRTTTLAEPETSAGSVDQRDTGEASHAMPEQGLATVNDEHDSPESEIAGEAPSDEHVEDDDVRDTEWPLLYKILDVDPGTDSAHFRKECLKCVSRQQNVVPTTQHANDWQAKEKVVFEARSEGSPK